MKHPVSFHATTVALCLVALCPGTSSALRDGLRLSTYATASDVREFAQSEEARNRAAARLNEFHMDKIFLEVYRGGLRVPVAELEQVRDFFLRHGIEVVGGIATVPGGDVGVPANAGLQWYNFQHPKTRLDMADIMRSTAPVFDSFVIDDFLCTGDLSPMSDQARGARSWSDYRRDLMTAASLDSFVGPARAANPGITMIVKFPQWYDKFHEYGYDVERMPQLFDMVWVGTETRGSLTQRYGYAQPYMGFVNYRWMRENAGTKIGGAWFDYGDCGPHEFVEQAWQSVLAGALELTFFCYGNLIDEHPDHAVVIQDLPRLQTLARAVCETPVSGIPAYKPRHSPAQGDLFLMDALGMLGVPLVPAQRFPERARRIFLPTQAAADPTVLERIEAQAALETVVMTAGFLAALPTDSGLAQQTGLAAVSVGEPLSAREIMVDGQPQALEPPLRLAADLKADGATVLLEAVVDGRRIPVLTERAVGGRRYVVLNTSTYTEADYQAVNEVLLPPAPLGLLSVPQMWADTLRQALSGATPAHLPDGAMPSMPARVTFQPLGRGWFLNNYHNEAVDVALLLARPAALRDGFTRDRLGAPASRHALSIPARGRLWINAD